MAVKAGYRLGETFRLHQKRRFAQSECSALRCASGCGQGSSVAPPADRSTTSFAAVLRIIRARSGPSSTAPQASPAGKKQRGRGQLLDHRAAWYEAVGTQPDEAATIQLVSYLQVKALRDRIMADMINPAEDEGTYRAVFMGQHPERPDWSRVDACEVLLVQLLAYTPAADRAPLFSALGWLAWYKGKGSLAAAYLAKALESEPGYRLAELLDEMLRTGLLAKTATNASTAYKRGNHS
ncbi:DUF4192 domain-containing protein [Arthrobacter gengyunqii]|uniref:DUF4192 domain-containing protein n=1 Tax=Arthrobacter gengyunqii TaxID=2886940 RepID=A0A9X1M3B1_9MICC|nr:DUF4192 family protein [Arthrobacter gengyunqii]MCC3270456.1 DUF4192 domain-containing protein [Arthrobacter gengyunqii]UOY97829.1 DUF4192 domain-containing protein [Arthrobacter gengyunqii]